MGPDALRRTKKIGGDGTIVMMLSLNLIILSFFILLNALASQSEEKAKLAAISTQKGQLTAPSGATEGLDESFQNIARWQNQTQANVQGVLSNTIKLDAVGMEKNAEKLLITLPLNLFFTEGGLTMREASLGFLQNILAVLDAGSKASVLVQQPANAMALGVQQSAALLKHFAADSGKTSPITPGWRLGKPALVLVLAPPAGPQGADKLNKAVAPAATLGTLEGR